MELLIFVAILIGVLSSVGFAKDVKKRVKEFDENNPKKRRRR